MARALVNDLDLTVNADSLNGYSLHGNGAKDYVNNAEQVPDGTIAGVSDEVEWPQFITGHCSEWCCAERVKHADHLDRLRQ